ncbi:citrate lyase subunit gamma [bacterium]|nr:citrate lyase subunit gamma [bacterium]
MPKPSTAGRQGENIRSDCWISVEPRDSGGIEIVLNSRVESMYGDSIRELCREGLTKMEIQNAHIEIEDYGALPWTIMARIETAVHRAGLNPPEWLPEMKQHSEYSTSRDRFRRSRLYLPGNEPRFFINAGLHKPDCIILDLEDSVAPAEKDAARVLVRNTLRTVNFYGTERMVRINQGKRGLEDLEWIVPHNVHVVLIPKVESAEQVQAVDEKIDEILTRCHPSAGDSKSSGQPQRVDRSKRPYLMPIIESALGGIKAYEIATASPNNVALAVGLEDYTADIGVQRTLKGRESFLMRSMIVNAARAAGIQPIDTVFSDVADIEGLQASVIEAKSLGFDGKGCIHPRQIAVINRAFAPTNVEIEKAQKIVMAFDKAEKEGLGVVSLGSKMIDPPVVKRALRTVEMAKALGLIK